MEAEIEASTLVVLDEGERILILLLCAVQAQAGLDVIHV